MFIYESDTNDEETRGAILEAKKMALQGCSPKKIHETTRCHQGPDDRWRHEISDAGARATGKIRRHGQVGTLGEALDHPTLYRADPSLRDVRLEIDKNLPARGVYIAPSDKIKIRSASDARDVALVKHEAMHAQQLRGGAFYDPINHHDQYNKQNKEIEAYDVAHRMRSGGQETLPDLARKRSGARVTARTSR